MYRVTLLCLALSAGLAHGQPPRAPAPMPPKAPPVQAVCECRSVSDCTCAPGTCECIACSLPFVWRANASKPSDLALYRGSVQVGAWCRDRQQYFPIRAGEWAAPVSAPPVALPVQTFAPVYQPPAMPLVMPAFQGMRGGNC